MRRISFVCVGILSTLLFMSIVSAVSANSFSFDEVGDNDTGNEVTVSGYPSVIINHNQTDADAQLGISVQSKHWLLGWKMEARTDKWIKGESRTIVDYTSLERGKTYRPVLVFNATRDNKPISGSYEVV